MAASRAQVLQFKTATTDTNAQVDFVSAVPEKPTGLETAMFSPAPAAAASTSRLMTLQNLGNGRTLIYPLYVIADQDGESAFVASPDLALVGRGDSEWDAVDDLREQVAELFDSLIEMRETLGPHLRRQLEFLERLAGTR